MGATCAPMFPESIQRIVRSTVSCRKLHRIPARNSRSDDTLNRFRKHRRASRSHCSINFDLHNFRFLSVFSGMRVLIVTSSTNLLKQQTLSPLPPCRRSRFMSSHILTPTVHCTPPLTPSLPVTYSATLNSYCTPIRLLDMNTFTLIITPGRSQPRLGALHEYSRPLRVPKPEKMNRSASRIEYPSPPLTPSDPRPSEPIPNRSEVILFSD